VFKKDKRMTLLATAREARYRLFRLRRLIAVATVPPVLTAYLLGRVGPEDMLVFAAVVCAAMALHAVIFPIVILETLALSLSLSAVLAMFSWETGMLGFWTLLGAGVLLFVISMVIQILLGWLQTLGPLFKFSPATQLVIACPIADARRTIPYRPDQDIERRSCGPADPEGRFTVTSQSISLDLETGEDTLVGWEMEAKIIEDSPSSQTTLSWFNSDEAGVTTHQFEPHPHGCRVGVIEPETEMTIGMALCFWMQDFMADHLQAQKSGLGAQIDRAASRAHVVAALLVLRRHRGVCERALHASAAEESEWVAPFAAWLSSPPGRLWGARRRSPSHRPCVRG